MRPAPSRGLLFVVSVVSSVLGTASVGLARQPGPSVATTPTAIARYPSFFHGRTVSISATPIRAGGLWLVETGTTTALAVQPTSGQVPIRPLELRGMVLDPTVLSATDARRSQIRAITDVFVPGRTAAKSTLLVLANAVWTDAAPPAAVAILRQVVLNPQRWEGQVVTVRGRFRGRNLYAELPAAPGRSATDFVLQAADAAIWITGLPPRGGGFNFDVLSRIDAARWLEVTGTVHEAAGVARIEATSMEETTAAAEIVPIPPAPVFRLPRPVVVFSVPVDRDDDVDPQTAVRIQFSRDLKEASLAGHIVVSYVDDDEPLPASTTRYRTRSIEIRFASPLKSGARVVVRLGDGITALDGAPLQPAEIRFALRGGHF